MRNTLISIAAWALAVCVVLWQRAIWPGLKSFLPGLEDLVAEVRSDVQPSVPTPEPAPVETLVIARKPAPKRVTRTAPKRTAKSTAGFAA
jgi:hypothetical protein